MKKKQLKDISKHELAEKYNVLRRRQEQAAKDSVDSILAMGAITGAAIFMRDSNPKMADMLSSMSTGMLSAWAAQRAMDIGIRMPPRYPAVESDEPLTVDWQEFRPGETPQINVTVFEDGSITLQEAREGGNTITTQGRDVTITGTEVEHPIMSREQKIGTVNRYLAAMGKPVIDDSIDEQELKSLYDRAVSV